MGYGALSGAARTALSALRKYGLLEDHGDNVRVSDLAIKILVQPEGSEERIAAIRTAAFKPEIIKELATSHGHMPNDLLRAHLISERKFSEAGADQFILALRDTLALVARVDPDYDPSMAHSDVEIRVADTTPPSDPARAALRPRMYSWALSKGISAELRIMGDPLTKVDADRLRQYVDLTVNALATDESQKAS